MSKLYIKEFGGKSGSQSGNAQIAQTPAIVSQAPLDFSAGAVTSSAFDQRTTIVRVHTDAVCSISIGANPTATTNSARMAANQTEYFGVRPGDKISVIANT